MLDTQDDAEMFYGRAAEMVLRVASIVAIGRLDDEAGATWRYGVWHQDGADVMQFHGGGYG